MASAALTTPVAVPPPFRGFPMKALVTAAGGLSPGYDSGSLRPPAMSARGEMLTRDGAATAIDDAADVTLNNGSETAIVAADAARRAVILVADAANTGAIRIGKQGQVGAARGA